MIREIHIKDFALIKNTVLNFKQGFNVLFGETVAGKSIILKAISFILGEKANKEYIRTGSIQLSVKAVFEGYSAKTEAILRTFAIENEGVIIIHRTLDIHGRSECRVNGQLLTLAMLKELSSSLVDSYAQHENLILLKQSSHLSILDSFDQNEISQLKTNVKDSYHQFQEIKNKIDELGGNKEFRQQQIELLDYQIHEIESAGIQQNEDVLLLEKLEVIRNSEKISTNLQNSYQNLSASNASVITTLKNTIKDIEKIVIYSNDFEPLLEKLNTSLYEIEDSAHYIRQKIDESAFSEYEFNKITERIDFIKTLKRKYLSPNQELNEIFNFVQECKNKHNTLIHDSEKIKELTQKLEAIEKKLLAASLELSQKRRKIAVKMQESLVSELSMLGMKNSSFLVNFKRQLNENTLKDCTANGCDEVEFLFSANKGEALKPLIKTISGGEMSRFMLALKNLIASKEDVQILIFDEIDAGISGAIGSAIAERIARLAKNFQVICITHLPQVAAMGDNYLYVSKSVVENKTETSAKIVDGKEIYHFIAKLSGGNYTSEISIAHGQELKSWADNYKQNLN